MSEVLALGKTISHSSGLKFGIRAKDRRQHIYVVGQTGTGKSTLLKNMAIQDLRCGQGLCVIDPHGELAEDILNFIPRSRTNEVVYFNPSDTEYPIGLNVLEVRNEQERHLVASTLISIFKHLWKDFWGPRLEHIFHNAILALMDTQDSTLLGIYRLLADNNYRQAVVARIKDPVVKLFWKEDFENYPDSFKKEVASPIQNKIGQLLTNAHIRNIVGQAKSSIDMRFIMDNKRILLVNLAKGRIGEDKANLLGSVITTKLYLAALEREYTRRPEAGLLFIHRRVSEFLDRCFSVNTFGIKKVSFGFNPCSPVFAPVVRKRKARCFWKCRNTYHLSRRRFGRAGDRGGVQARYFCGRHNPYRKLSVLH